MAEIRILDSYTIDQIAAGEVIERPASVVKELVENALDAGADRITVELRGGGTELIRVSDNGCGIPADQVAAAFARHATSKIVSAEDLFALTTLGFRGEALSSIASVARVELITRTAEADHAVRYVIEGGKELSSGPVGAPQGTTFYVRDLFFNTPVRRKFLKSAASESAYVSALMEQLCLSRPGISMQLIVNGQSKLLTTGSYRMKDILYTIYGRETAGLMRPVHYEENGIRAEGYTGLPSLSRGSRSGELTFLNGRSIKSPLLIKAIEQAYHGLTMQHKFPAAVLHLHMDPSLVDVNVHPAKTEVRFRREKDVFDTVFHAVRETLFAGDLIPEVSGEPVSGKQTETGGSPAERPDAAAEMRPEGPADRDLPAETKTAEAAEKPAAGTAAQATGATGGKSPSPYLSPGPAASFREIFSYRTEADRRLLEELLAAEKSAPKEGAGGAGGQKQRGKEDEAAIPEEEFFNPAPNLLAASRTAQAQTAPARCAAPETPPAAEKPSAAIPDGPGISPETVSATVPDGPGPSPETAQSDLFASRILTPSQRGRFRLIGQLFETYWLMEYEDQFLLCDQHAVHEKILYERTMRSLSQRENTSQLLSPPLLLTLGGQQEETLQRIRPSLERLGFEIGEMGGRQYGVSAVPGNLFGLDPRALLTGLLDEMSEERQAPPSAIDAKVALMSCKAAVKGSTRLSAEEAEALLGELMTLENPYTCPHGRPTMIRMSRKELEKKFRRIV